MNSKTTLSSFLPLSLVFILISSFSGFGQNKQPNLVSSYKEYTELPREIAYAHLNKTTYLKGEILGYTAYIFDKANHKLSKTATNVYCTLSDENNKIVKNEMILAHNGVGSGSFQIDSLFTSGKYIFRAYTNWMRNFDEQNYYVQTIQILDSNTENIPQTEERNSTIDAQFLPEGGHFVTEVTNSVGVIVKDNKGLGIPYMSAKVVDSKNNTLTNFKTNGFGIGKFIFTPQRNEIYNVILDIDGSVQKFPIKNIENDGIAITMNDVDNKVALSFRTNQSTLKQIKNQKYTLAIHNGEVLKTVDFTFGKSQEVVKVINYEDLTSGINIFTLFNENNNPILERLFFKYDGIELLSAANPSTSAIKDSLTITIPLSKIDKRLFNNFSVSVLPEETKSYNPNNNIISETYLQPYIKSYVEDAAYYFTDVTRKKKFELDNVLLTQGWSSYDWNTIFNHPPKANYEYENGISFRANVNKNSRSDYMMYATINNEMELFDLEEGAKDFGAVGLYPMDSEVLRFSSVKKNNHIERPNLYLQFSPSRIPDLNQSGGIPPLIEKRVTDTYSAQNILKPSWENMEELEEVVIQGNKKLSREDQLTRTAFGKVKIIDDQTRKSYVYFADFIRSQGFKVFESGGKLVIYNPRPVSFGQGATITSPGTLSGSSNTFVKQKTVIVYLNNVPLKNTDFLYKYTLDDIDYITFDKSGTSEGGLGAAGVIKIYTDPLKAQSKMGRNVSQDINVPLTFSSPKKFYAPEYSSYNGPFFRDYGVIDWFPNLTVTENGTLNFTIARPKINNISIFIEGTANDGSFISERKNISIEQPDKSTP